MKNKDNTLKDFFENQKIDIKDNGFSQKVLQKIPQTHNRNWIVLIFAAMGALLSLWLGLQSGAIVALVHSISKIPFIYFLGTVFCFPILATPLLFFSKKTI